MKNKKFIYEHLLENNYIIGTFMINKLKKISISKIILVANEN